MLASFHTAGAPPALEYQIAAYQHAAAADRSTSSSLTSAQCIDCIASPDHFIASSLLDTAYQLASAYSLVPLIRLHCLLQRKLL